MITIQNLEVQFDVEGQGDEAVFARLFEQYMRRYAQNEQRERERERRNEEECRIGGPTEGTQR